MAHYYQNDTDAAVQAFGQAFEEAVALQIGTGIFYVRAFAMSWLARLYVLQGHLQQAKGIYQEALALATEQTGKLLSIAAWAFTGLG